MVVERAVNHASIDDWSEVSLAAIEQTLAIGRRETNVVVRFADWQSDVLLFRGNALLVAALYPIGAIEDAGREAALTAGE